MKSENEIRIHPFRALLLDIEGTTTPIAFVHDVLFPYARTHARTYLTENLEAPEVVADLASLRAEHSLDLEQGHNPPPLVHTSQEMLVESTTAYVEWLIDLDRKSTGLKSLQGRIWKAGYLTGKLKAQVFADVAPALRRWSAAGLTINIFSSGSVLAQKLLFAYTDAGDLTGHISNYFDTNVGAKSDVESYRTIATSLYVSTSEVLFISDVTRELEAASAAGMRVLLSIRPGNLPQPSPERYPMIHSFDEV